MRTSRRRQPWLIAGSGLVLTLVALALAWQLPFVQDHLGWRVSELKARIQYAIRPPQEAVFTPNPTLAAMVQATLLAYAPSPTSTPTPGPTDLPVPTRAPTATPNAIPEAVDLPGVVYVDQHNRWNYCGPANLTMALKFWGWPGNRDDVARVVKPGIQDPNLDFIQRGRLDKNVMPYELADFVNSQTEFRALIRYGGDVDLLKHLIAAGFPVVVEKGYYEADYTGQVAWMGHYLFTTGYDDAAGQFTVQDAYLVPGHNLHVAYADYLEGWRSFDYLFMVVYPPDRESELLDVLGPWSDPNWAAQNALDIASREANSLTGIDEFFAWFNQGTSLVQLLRYPEAATAYDRAFSLYAQLGGGDNQRPYRMLWYQTGPYWAYFYSGRYQDVINLADTTLYDTIAEPTLEESLYWRGLAKEALGDTEGARADLVEAVRLNPNFSAAKSQLSRLNGG